MIRSFLVASIGNDIIQYELNLHCLPHELRYNKQWRDDRFFELDWSPMLDEASGQIEKVLLAIKDVTHLKALQQEALAHEREISKIIEIASIDARQFTSFIEAARSYLLEGVLLLDRSRTVASDDLKVVFRNLHTVKGLARNCNFSRLASSIHQIETMINGHQQGMVSPDWWSVLRQNMDELIHEVDSYHSLAKIKLGFRFDKDTIEIPLHELQSWYDEGMRILRSMHELEAARQWANQLQAIKRSYAATLQNLLQDEWRAAVKLASDLGKAAPAFETLGTDVYVNRQKLATFRTVFVHLIRNSLDHGIETSDERSAKGKSESGAIFIQAETRPGEPYPLVIRFWDDGQGLNLEALKDRAVENGLCDSDESDWQKISNCIFRSGISTKTSVSEISGRGVGLSAVSSFLAQEGGSITIEADGSINDGKYLAFRFLIKLPATFLDDEGAAVKSGVLAA